MTMNMPGENAYTGFAEVYDRFMDNVPYDTWCAYLVSLLREEGIEDGLLLDLGCGTGSLTERLAAEGYDMIGVDNSEEMLAQAMDKRVESGRDILYLLQDMRSFELYGTVRAIVSLCDCVNYILTEEDLAQVFRLANNYLDPGGVFIFDLNTEYKYASMGSRTIAEDREDCSFIWENEYDPETRINEYDLTLFIRDAAEEPDEDEEEGLFRRFMETHYQRAYSLEEIRSCLEEAGMEYITAYDAFTKEAPRPDSERIYVVAREKRQEGKLYL